MIAVIFGHFWGDEHIWEGISKSGVELFFVLSGRLMAEILFIRRSDLITFFVRRFSRIFPALIAFVAVTTIAFSDSQLSHGPLAVFVALTMTLNYAMIYTHPIGLMDHLWSLCVEEHAYVILAAIALISRRRAFSYSAVIALIGFLALANGVVRLDVLNHGALETLWRSDVSLAGIFISAALWVRFRSSPLPAWLFPMAFAIAIATRVQDAAILSFGVSTIALATAVVALDCSNKLIRSSLSLLPLRV